MLTALLFSAFTAGSIDHNTTISCVFPDPAAERGAIHLEIRRAPSLKDLPDQWRASLSTGQGRPMPAVAEPIQSTNRADILVRGVARRKSDPAYIVGIDAAGNAALNRVWRDADAEMVRRETNTGRCENAAGWISAYLGADSAELR